MKASPETLIEGRVGALNRIHVHSVNADLATELVTLAAKHGLAVRRNNTNYLNWDGYHAYVLLEPGICRDFSIKSQAVVAYSIRRNSRYYMPSMSGERSALKWLIRQIKER